MRITRTEQREVATPDARQTNVTFDRMAVSDTGEKLRSLTRIPQFGMRPGISRRRVIKNPVPKIVKIYIQLSAQGRERTRRKPSVGFLSLFSIHCRHVAGNSLLPRNLMAGSSMLR